MKQIFTHDITRCDWCGDDPLYVKYHDEEWGEPVYDDKVFFEFLVLESFQAGLSWITILRKRENFRAAFDNFDWEKIAKYGSEKITELIANEGIIRNKLKIEATINNAARFMEVQGEFGSFSNYIWSFTGGEIIKGEYENIKELPARTELSDRISKDLKKRGFKFVGSTIVYAKLQSMGIVNDHLKKCFKHKLLN